MIASETFFERSYFDSLQFKEDYFRGEHSAFERIETELRGPAFSIIGKIIRDPHSAEDAWQEAMINLYDGRYTYKPDRKFSSWFFKVVHNSALNILRRDKRKFVSLDEPRGDRGLSLAETLVVPANDPSVKEYAQLALSIAEHLRERGQVSMGTLIDRIIYDMAHMELARSSGCTLMASLHRVMDAKCRLRKILGKE